MQNLGEEEAQRLLDAGWRQGSVFTSNDIVGVPHGFEPGQRLIVLTQSCTIVSRRWDVDPHVEVATAVAVAKFNERSPEARGKNLRKLHVPLGGDAPDALAINLNSRALVDRRLFLKFEPDGNQPDASEGRRIGGWIARYYSRVALPNALVGVLQAGALKALETALKTKFGEGTVHDRISNIYINWSPDDESGGPYDVGLLLLATDEDAADFAGNLLFDLLPKPTPRLTVTHDALSAESTYVADVEGRVRFTEFDYLSDLADEDVRV